MKNEVIKLEFSDIDIIDNPKEDWAVREYPIGTLTKMMIKANEIGLQGKKIKVVEVLENFGTHRKYIDFIIK